MQGVASLLLQSGVLVLALVDLGDREEGPAGDSPGTGDTGNDTTRDEHGAEPPGALEEHATQRASGNGVGGVVLPPEVPDGAVEAVVGDGDNAGGVAKEGATAGDGVEDGVQAQLGWLVDGPPQTLLQAPSTSEAEGGEICDASAVAEIICEAARRKDGLAAWDIGEGGVFEGEVFESVLVETGQRV